MASMIDFRRLDEGLGGPKNKRKRVDDEDDESRNGGQAMEIFQPAKRAAVAGQNENKPVYGKASYEGVRAGKVSGRKWKQPKVVRASALKQVGRKSTLEEKNRDREIKKAYKERKNELKEQIRSHKQEKRQRMEERKKQKKENELKSIPVQRITNPKTLKKMSKKQRKLLRVVPD